MAFALTIATVHHFMLQRSEDWCIFSWVFISIYYMALSHKAEIKLAGLILANENVHHFLFFFFQSFMAVPKAWWKKTKNKGDKKISAGLS